MNDDDFMNELQELTKNMTKEFSTNEKSTQSVKDSSTPSFNNGNVNTNKNDNFNFDLNFEGNEGDYMKEIEKLLSMGMGMDMGNMQIDDSDPQTKEMMKLLSKLIFKIFTIFKIFISTIKNKLIFFINRRKFKRPRN